MFTIYLVENKVNGKKYVGQTRKTAAHRWRQHIYDHLNRDLPLYRAIRKHGIESFVLREISHTGDRDAANDLERFWVSYFRSNNGINGYNATPGGESLSGKDNPFYGCSHSEESRKKMSLAKTGKYLGENNALFGRPLPEETKKKLSVSLTGRKSWCKGKKFSEEHCRNMSESRLRKEIVDADLIRLYHSGMSIRKISSELGFNRATIWWRLRRSGTQLRPVGFPPKKIGEQSSQILPLGTL